MSFCSVGSAVRLRDGRAVALVRGARTAAARSGGSSGSRRSASRSRSALEPAACRSPRSRRWLRSACSASSSFSIHSVCLLCEVVHVVSIALFVSVWRIRRELVPYQAPITSTTFSESRLFFCRGRLYRRAVVLARLPWKNGVNLPHGVEADGQSLDRRRKTEGRRPRVHGLWLPALRHDDDQLRQYLAKHASSLRVVHHNYPRIRLREGPRLRVPTRAPPTVRASRESSGKWTPGSSNTRRRAVDVSAPRGRLRHEPAKLAACVSSAGRSRARTPNGTRHSRLGSAAPQTFVLDEGAEGGDVFGVLKQHL